MYSLLIIADIGFVILTAAFFCCMIEGMDSFFVSIKEAVCKKLAKAVFWAYFVLDAVFIGLVSAFLTIGNSVDNMLQLHASRIDFSLLGNNFLEMLAGFAGMLILLYLFSKEDKRTKAYKASTKALRIQF